MDKAEAKIALNVLSLEDSILDFEIILEHLTSAGFSINITRVAKESEFTSSIRNNKYDIILADFNLHGFDGFAALKLCNEICPNTPFICISGSIGEEIAIDLMKQGAVDYILKDRLARLPSAVKRALDESKEKEIRRKAEEALQKKMDELQRFYDLTIGRELKMIELKKEINELLKQMGKEEKYKIVG
ncbi:MAG: response regulator [Bacteroidales bacterium]|nr:response regulator [Bacteroidales bacterium]